MKYKIDINGKEFVLGKTGIYPILLDDADVLDISVRVRNYYSGESVISKVKANDRIVISPAYNKKVYLVSFLLALCGLAYGMITEKRIPGTLALLLFLGVQIYYFNIRSAEFFQISVKE
jgi:hypothetical protein